VPYAAGGRPTVDNIALRLRAHNDHEAEMFYGPITRGRVTDDAFRSGTTSVRSGTTATCVDRMS
jgi:hypothetical protein